MKVFISSAPRDRIVGMKGDEVLREGVIIKEVCIVSGTEAQLHVVTHPSLRTSLYL